MLLIYLLDDVPNYAARVKSLLEQSFERQDHLFTSFVGLGEVMAGAYKAAVPSTPAMIRKTMDDMGFTYLRFDLDAVDTFSRLRSVHRVKTADAIHLSSAAAAGIDLFLTHDERLVKLHVPGIHFIADIFTSPM